MTSDYAFAPPPTLNNSSPRRRHQEQQPPTLSTALSAVHRFGSHLTGRTPTSATSTSTSPFQGHGYNPSTFTASPATYQSPNSNRNSMTSNSAYNPQQWSNNPTPIASPIVGPGYHPGPAQVTSRPALANGEPSPPPPYSPRHARQGHPSVSPADSAASASPNLSSEARSSAYNTPVSAATTISSVGPSGYPPGSQAQGPPRVTRSPQIGTSQFAPTTLPFRSTAHGLSGSSVDGTTVDLRADQSSSNVHRPQQPTRLDLNLIHRVALGGSSSSIDSTSQASLSDEQSRPPASRRAASTGCISSSSSLSAWEPGMPLPPPPPGPPPTSRSQSMNRSLDGSSRSFNSPSSGAAPLTRRPVAQGSNLPPVPPTPLDWVDDDRRATPSPVHRPSGLSLVRSAPDIPQSDSAFGSSSIADSGAPQPTEPGHAPPRDSSVQGIRERRSQSRVGQERRINPLEPTNNPWADNMHGKVDPKPTDLVLPAATTSLKRTRTLSKSTPRSPRGLPSAPPSSSSAGPTSGFSTGQSPQSQSRMTPILPPPPPLNRKSPETHLGRRRPLHMSQPSNSSQSEVMSQSQSLMASTSTPTEDSPSTDSFMRLSIERHRSFSEREAAAKDDRERVQLFAEFIVAESRIRREKYSEAFDGLGSEILELTRDLFKPFASSKVQTPSSGQSSWSPHQGSLGSAVSDSFTPNESPMPRPDSGWAGAYHPSLSPIPSMSVSVSGDQSSRGRPSSRWWEASQESVSAGGARKVERSKRESKYMGLPIREWDSSSATSTAAPADQANEYPPEKVGWHEPLTPKNADTTKLDVSRLVTIPPPFPRHYPAVNNKHPNLGPLRTVVRELNDQTRISNIKEAFRLSSEQSSIEDRRRRSLLRADIRLQINEGTMSYAEAAKLEETQVGIEKARVKSESERFQLEVLKPVQQILQENINRATGALEALKRQLNAEPPSPLEEGDDKPELLEKLTLLKWLFEARELQHRASYTLLSEKNARFKQVVIAPYDQPDKIAEVEAFFRRDACDRAVAFEQEALARFEAFMDVVEDNVKRGVELQLSTFWDIAPSLMEVVARIDVGQGVQMAAATTTTTPTTNGFSSSSSGGAGTGPSTPAAASTGDQYAFSQQYLWEVLCHAEKSAHQFIDAQVNLLCLLHEVKIMRASQGCRVMEAERRAAAGPLSSLSEQGGGSGEGRGEGTDEGGEGEDRARAEMAEILKDEEARLTEDLKEKVGMVEGQWEEVMGRGVGAVKGLLRAWLEEHGGWEGVEEE